MSTYQYDLLSVANSRKVLHCPHQMKYNTKKLKLFPLQLFKMPFQMLCAGEAKWLTTAKK